MSSNKEFFVVDDDEIFLFTATYVLGKAFPAVKIITSRNGEEALEKLENQQPNALFVDLNMPIMDGWELLDRLGKKYDAAPFPIIVVTSSIDPSDKKKAANHHLRPTFIEKPLSEEKVKKLEI